MAPDSRRAYMCVRGNQLFVFQGENLKLFVFFVCVVYDNHFLKIFPVRRISVLNSWPDHGPRVGSDRTRNTRACAIVGSANYVLCMVLNIFRHEDENQWSNNCAHN